MASPARSPTACFRFVSHVMKAFRDNGGHDTATIGSLSLVSAKPGQITTRLPLAKHNMNRLGSLHGGLICTLVDTMGSLALASKGLYSTGVSTDIHTTFVKAAGGVGEEVLVMGQVTSLGKTLATTRVELRHPVSDALLAFGSHTKFVGKAHQHADNVEFDAEGENVIKGKGPEEWTEGVKLTGQAPGQQQQQQR